MRCLGCRHVSVEQVQNLKLVKFLRPLPQQQVNSGSSSSFFWVEVVIGVTWVRHMPNMKSGGSGLVIRDRVRSNMLMT